MLCQLPLSRLFIKKIATAYPVKKLAIFLLLCDKFLRVSGLCGNAVWESVKDMAGEKRDHRSSYRRDAGRILHSKSYARYVDKTQVVYLVADDHISHRSLHVQLVSHLARSIAEQLQLDLALVEAIALGHDVGHPPFGHEGEQYLSKISQQLGLGLFAHPWQSCHLFTLIEPLNLSLEVCDGILCHDGGLQKTTLQPQKKSWDDHREDLAKRLKDPEIHLIPMTLEGCLVKICDTVSYLSRDLEDAIHLKLISRSQIPATILGSHPEEVLRIFTQDVVEHSGSSSIGMSQQLFDALRTLRNFNFEHIYFHPNLKTESAKICRSYSLLADFLIENAKRREQSYIWQNFLHTKSAEYLSQTSSARQVVDYIAGMTDGFFIRTFNKIFTPSPIGLL